MALGKEARSKVGVVFYISTLPPTTSSNRVLIKLNPSQVDTFDKCLLYNNLMIQSAQAQCRLKSYRSLPYRIKCIIKHLTDRTSNSSGAVACVLMSCLTTCSTLLTVYLIWQFNKEWNILFKSEFRRGCQDAITTFTSTRRPSPSSTESQIFWPSADNQSGKHRLMI